ncbi:MAG: TonB-dependent receptor, partial [Treponema sp.]|nr:TonB-dependent receptor [Treponema sp.]
TKITSDSSVKTFLNAEFPADTFTQSAGVSSQITENTFAKLNIKGTYAQNKYQFKNFFGKTKTRQNAEVKDLHADAKVSHFFGNGSSFTIGEMFYQGDKNCPGEITGAHKGNQKDLDSAFTANLFNPQLLDKFTVENNAAWLFTRRLYDEGPSHSEHIINTFKYAGYASADFTSWYSQSFGLTSDTVFLDSTDDGQHVQPSFCIKGTSKFFPARHITLTLPMAVKICGENSAFVPKAGIKFSFETAEFMLDAYRMIQFPNMDDLYWNGAGAKGNPDLKTEDGWGGEVTFTLKKYLPFTVSVFSNYYRNKIQWASSSGILMPRNLASAFYLGFDLRTELSFFDGHFKISANCECLYTELLDKSKPESYGNRIMWTPDWTAAASASLIAGDFDLRAEWNYMGRRYTDNTNVTYLEPYSLINFCVSYTGSAHFTPYLRADNILDTEYEAVPSYPMPGISLTLGLRIIM